MRRWIIAGVVLLALTAGAAAWLAGTGSEQAESRADPDLVYDPIVAGEEFEGGIRWVVSRDGIRPIYEPTFVPAAASALAPDDLVLGLSIDGDSRAYPIGLLAAREIVNDWVGETPVIVSW